MKLPDVIISIDGITYDNSFNTDITIDRTNLEEEFATQAEKYYYYAFLAQLAGTKAAYKKADMEQLYARIDHEKRMTAQAAQTKLTEKMAENEVITDPRYQLAQRDYLDAQLMANQLTEAARSMAQRREMLIQLGGIARQQMAPQRVVEQQAGTAQSLIAQTRAAQPQLPAAEPASTAAAPGMPARRRQPTT